jgi:hypothetical protein
MKKSKLQVIAMFFLALPLLINSCGQNPRQENTEVVAVVDTINMLTAEEAEEGFILMFDGKSFDGWRGYNRPDFPQAGWVIENGMLKVQESGAGETGGAGGDIIYDQKFMDFHLKLDWMVSEGGNSGILYLAQEIENEPIWKSAPEMQILDNEKHIELYEGFSSLQMAGSLYDLVAAYPQNTYPAGQWNSIEIIVDDGIILHRQNGELVVEFQIDSPDWEEKVSTSKFAEFPWFGKYEPGYIGLQDHGDDVWFKNIKIKEL